MALDFLERVPALVAAEMGNAMSNSPSTPPPSPCKLTPLPPTEDEQHVETVLSHIRANTDQGWVSIEDALSYLYPKMSNFEITQRMNRLPRVAQIYAGWGASCQKDLQPDMLFRACSYDNIYLATYDMPHCNEKIQQLKDDIAYVVEHGQCPLVKPMLLVKDARPTAAQVRYTRDIRDRLTNEEYYSRKRTRDAVYRLKKKHENISEANDSSDGTH